MYSLSMPTDMRPKRNHTLGNGLQQESSFLEPLLT